MGGWIEESKSCFKGCLKQSKWWLSGVKINTSKSHVYGRMDGWMDGSKSWYKDCLQQQNKAF